MESQPIQMTQDVLGWTLSGLLIPEVRGANFRGRTRALWGIAQIIDVFPRGEPRVIVRSVHILLGVVLGAVLLYRLAWRASGARRLPEADTGFAKLAAQATHYGLYALLAATVVLGLANIWVRGDSIFGLFSVPAFDPSNTDLRHTIGSLHGTVANIILIVAGIHGAAALGHHFVLKDGVLRRMLPKLG